MPAYGVVVSERHTARKSVQKSVIVTSKARISRSDAGSFAQGVIRRNPYGTVGGARSISRHTSRNLQHGGYQNPQVKVYSHKVTTKRNGKVIVKNRLYGSTINMNRHDIKSFNKKVVTRAHANAGRAGARGGGGHRRHNWRRDSHGRFA